MENFTEIALPITPEPMWTVVSGQDVASAVATGVLVLAGIVLAVAMVVTFAAGCAGLVAFIAGGPTKARFPQRVALAGLGTAVVAFVPFLIYELTTGVVMSVRLLVMVVAPVVVWAGFQVVRRRRGQTRTGLGPAARGVDVAGGQLVGGADADLASGRDQGTGGWRGQSSRVDERVPPAEG